MIKKYLPIIMIPSLLLFEIILKVDPTIGFFCYTILVTGCLIILENQERLDLPNKLMIIILILPMIRVAELFIPLGYMWKTLIVYIALLFLSFIYSVKFDINPGFKKKGLRLLLLAVIFGVVLGTIGSKMINENYRSLIFIIPLIVFAEELFFRGMLQNLTHQIYGNKISIIFPSLIYVIFSLNYTAPVILLFFLVSLANSLVYHYTKNIFLPIGLSLTFHFFMAISPIISL
jgi:membrane protease YdiL (CAAX protease family)